MRDFGKIDILTYAALCVSVICLAVTGYMQQKNKDSIKLLADNAVTQEYVSEIPNKTESYNNTHEQTTEETTTKPIITEEQTTLLQASFNTTADNSSSKTQLSNNKLQSRTSKATSKANTTSKVITQKTENTTKPQQLDTAFVYSVNSKKLHSRSCPYVARIKDENKRSISADELQQFLDNGYTFCSHCQGYVQ